MEKKKECGTTITLVMMMCSWQDHQINIINTSGHVDFTLELEVERCPSACWTGPGHIRRRGGRRVTNRDCVASRSRERMSVSATCSRCLPTEARRSRLL
jgi:hypothetical protein